MPGSLISVKEASARYGYCESHIRSLLARGVIVGEKFAGVWIVDPTSTEQHQVQMEWLGKKKHGLWRKVSE